MCRRNHLLGFGCMMFGFGVLIGSILEPGFLCTCFWIAAAAVGISFLRKK